MRDIPHWLKCMLECHMLGNEVRRQTDEEMSAYRSCFMTLPLLLHIEDPIKNTEDIQGFVGDSLHVANNNMHNSDVKDIQKDVSF